MNDTMNYIFGSLSKGREFMARQTKFNLMVEVCLIAGILYYRATLHRINALQEELEELKKPKEE